MNKPLSQLISEDQQTWNTPLLQFLFSPEVECIQALPLCSSRFEDQLTLWYTKNDLHSIKSAYHLHLPFQNKNSCGSSGGQAKSNYWKSIWELKVSNSTKVFIWRACKNIWPTKTKLFHMKIVDNAVCPICFQCPETKSHILWECISARDVWSQTCKKNSKISLVMRLFYRYLA